MLINKVLWAGHENLAFIIFFCTGIIGAIITKVFVITVHGYLMVDGKKIIMAGGSLMEAEKVMLLIEKLLKILILTYVMIKHLIIVI